MNTQHIKYDNIFNSFFLIFTSLYSIVFYGCVCEDKTNTRLDVAVFEDQESKSVGE